MVDGCWTVMSSRAGASAALISFTTVINGNDVFVSQNANTMMMLHEMIPVPFDDIHPSGRKTGVFV
jgi:hypothetical protein